jgi:hypothetical protein
MTSASSGARARVALGFSRRGAILGSMLIAALLAGCTRAELEHKATAYNDAIAGSTNEAILINAVRASQRAPMSFTGLGQVITQPNFSGSLGADFGFDPLGLKTYALRPNVNANGGFSSFTMNNLNSEKFIRGLREPIKPDLVRMFLDLRWPEELVHLMAIASIDIKPQELARLNADAELVCRTRSDPRTDFYCEVIRNGKAAYTAANCHPFEERGTLLNTARDLCSMTTFQIVLRTARLLRRQALLNSRVRLRSAQGMLYYLGELIAAQNYSIRPYEPLTVVGTPAGRILAPLFVVRRGVVGPSAVQVLYNGELFSIPRPDVGAVNEARSLQVLDFVSQVIAEQTAAGDLPKVNTFGIVSIPQ